MQPALSDVVPDAFITIVIDPFTAPWLPPVPGQTSFSVDNCLPRSFIPVLSPPVQGRFTITQPGCTAPGGQYLPGGIVISGTGALTICFKVISGVGTSAVRYTETGLIFGLVTVGGRLERGHSKTGRDNFPNFISNDQGITVVDDASFASSYEFVLVIQNDAGGVAVVDPRITNTA